MCLQPMTARWKRCVPRLFHTVNFHGLRYSRDRYFDAAPSPSIFSVLAFHTIRRPERSATFPSKHVVVERCPISMSEVGLCRDLTQSRKLRTCVSPCLFSFLTRRAEPHVPVQAVWRIRVRRIADAAGRLVAEVPRADESDFA